MNVTSMLLFVGLFLVAGFGIFIEAMRLLFAFLAIRGVVQGERKRYRESIRTSFYTLVGWSISGVALYCYFSTVNVEPPDINDRIGKPLFVGFEPIDVKRLEIVEYDRETNQFKNFRVEQEGVDAWTIPTNQNYPADALQQVQAAANSLINLTVVNVVPQDEADDKLYGVVEPDAENTVSGEKGIGRLVTIRDKANRSLASLIVGNPVREKPEQRFVRIKGQEPIYIVEYDVSVLKTDFRDWIEKDLLLLDSSNIAAVTINDYQVDPDIAFAQNRIEITNSYDIQVKSEFGVWELESLFVYDDQKRPEQREIRPGERLNTEAFEEMRTALDQLQIVDVKRKPSGLSANLTAGSDFLAGDANIEARSSLKEQGFFPRDTGNGYEILSSNGEMVVKTRYGFDYVLRFGRIRTDGPEEASDGTLQRYLMVTARIDEDAFQLPIKPGSSDGDDGQTPPPPGSGDGEDASASQDDAEAMRNYEREVAAINDRLTRTRGGVQELNKRFADWYYVISEDAYLKLKIPRRELLIRQVAPTN